jgi:hypothetical protein
VDAEQVAAVLLAVLEHVYKIGCLNLIRYSSGKMNKLQT